MDFDLIMPTYKPGEEFKAILRAVGRQGVKPSKVIIVNTEEAFWSADFEGILPKEVPMEVRHISKEEFNHAGTRKWAAEELSDAPRFVFMTQDAVPADDRLFERLLSGLGEGVGAAYARQLAKDGAGEIERFGREFNYPKESRVKSNADLPKLG